MLYNKVTTMLQLGLNFGFMNQAPDCTLLDRIFYLLLPAVRQIPRMIRLNVISGENML